MYFKSCIFALLILFETFTCEGVSSQTKFTSLPFSFGLVLSAFTFEDYQDSSSKVENHQSPSSREDQRQSEDQQLRDVSVAEVLRHRETIKVRPGPAVIPLACLGESVLELDLNNGSLTSRQRYVASVDDNHQFQFEELFDPDVTSKFWSVSSEGQLVYEDVDLFYQCHSGESYKIYDAPVHSRCAPVLLDVVELVSCQ